jgi:hypothetical protein
MRFVRALVACAVVLLAAGAPRATTSIFASLFADAIALVAPAAADREERAEDAGARDARRARMGDGERAAIDRAGLTPRTERDPSRTRDIVLVADVYLRNCTLLC